MSTFSIPVHQYRSLPSPVGSSRAGMFYVNAQKIPKELWDWRDVNPREVSRRNAVYKNIVSTLTQDPERFHERNRGITIIADSIGFDEKKKSVILKFNDTKLHGVVDGAHTLDAILQGQEAEEESLKSAYVFFKIIDGVEPDQIAEIAGGLNTSEQVDLKSLENLREHFQVLRDTLDGQSYSGDIAYKMNEQKPVDVREILYYLAVFDSNEYSDKKHPVSLFGRKEGIVRRFAAEAASPTESDTFKILISKAPEILQLRDQIEKKALSLDVGRYKVSKSIRVRSKSNKKNHLLFLNESVDGKIPLGWLMPILAGFRANVKWDKPKGTFSWIAPIDKLLDKCVEDLVMNIIDVHEQENSRPEYVGRNSLAWRMSYNTVSQAILQWQLSNERRRK